MNDIAKKANVSISTVSKALNNYSDISESTRQKILEIARQINYRNVEPTKNPQSKSIKNIGLIFSGLKDSDSKADNFPSEFIGALRACQKYGYELVVLNTDSIMQTSRSLSDLCKKFNLLGFVIAGLTISDVYYNEMLTLDIPSSTIDLDMMMLNDDDLNNDYISIVTIDTQSAINDVVNLLYQKNHRNIGLINGYANAEISIIREQAFIKAMKGKDLEINEDYIRNGDFTEKKAYEEAKYLFTVHPEITAIFCASDLMALGVYEAAKELNKRIPDDIAIVGFDGIQLCQYLNPPLTTVKQDFKAMAAYAVENIIKRINGQSMSKICIVPYQLVIRGSI
ncbi:MAG: LacI family DNA-binding transcriptional regulator [Clostridiales bacterium]|nr:LacI family DNA-binding transcriptional regulator [Clostridiales bacterium]